MNNKKVQFYHWIKASERMPTEEFLTQENDCVLIRKDGKVWPASFDAKLGFIFKHNGAVAKKPFEYEWLAPVGQVVELMNELAAAVAQTFKQYTGDASDIKEGEYEISFLYPGDNKAYKMLRLALDKYNNFVSGGKQVQSTTAST